MVGLRAAHRGYGHQDAVVACALAALLVPRTGLRLVIVDKKLFEGDCFDDLELGAAGRVRVQVKSHSTATRALTLSDFSTDRICFRIDHALESMLKDPAAADRYVLLT